MPLSLQRKDVFLQTKRAVKASFQRLQIPYIDSVLIHKPRCWEGACHKQPEGTWQDSWTELEELYHNGTVRAIGICDVDKPLLTDLLSVPSDHASFRTGWIRSTRTYK